MGFTNRELVVMKEGYRRGCEAGFQSSFGPAYQRGLKLGLRLIQSELVTAVADLLDARGLAPADDLLARLHGCKDHALLRRAVVLAGTASSIDELTAEPWPKRRPTRSRKR